MLEINRLWCAFCSVDRNLFLIFSDISTLLNLTDICPEIKFSGKPPDIAILEEEYNVSTRFEVMGLSCRFLSLHN